MKNVLWIVFFVVVVTVVWLASSQVQIVYFSCVCVNLLLLYCCSIILSTCNKENITLCISEVPDRNCTVSARCTVYTGFQKQNLCLLPFQRAALAAL